MDMRDGMLGVVIIAIALAVALFGSYLAGVTPQEESVIKYNYLADVSGEFKYDQSPQYIDFDPSTNYTGYYSNDTYSESANKYYFAENQVEYTPNVNKNDNNKPIVNNYKVDLAPVEGEWKTDDLTESDVQTDGEWYTLAYLSDATSGNAKVWSHRNQPMSLTDMISYLKDPDSPKIDLGSNVLRITTGTVDWNGTRSSSDTLYLGAVLIIPDSWFQPYLSSANDQGRLTNRVMIYNPTVDESDLKISEVYKNYTFYKPYLSYEINMETGYAVAYRNADFTDSDKTFATDHLWVCFGENQYAGYLDYLNLADDINIQDLTTRTSYLDPDYGVSLKDTED